MQTKSSEAGGRGRVQNKENVTKTAGQRNETILFAYCNIYVFLTITYISKCSTYKDAVPKTVIVY